MLSAKGELIWPSLGSMPIQNWEPSLSATKTLLLSRLNNDDAAGLVKWKRENGKKFVEEGYKKDVAYFPSGRFYLCSYGII